MRSALASLAVLVVATGLWFVLRTTDRASRGTPPPSGVAVATEAPQREVAELEAPAREALPRSDAADVAAPAPEENAPVVETPPPAEDTSSDPAQVTVAELAARKRELEEWIQAAVEELRRAERYEVVRRQEPGQRFEISAVENPADLVRSWDFIPVGDLQEVRMIELRREEYPELYELRGRLAKLEAPDETSVRAQ